jgi:GNAT superfamily N-acetyltransferase
MNPLENWPLELVAAHRRADALEMIWAGIEPALRESLRNAAVAESHNLGADYWAGLVSCEQDELMQGVAWVQAHAGRVASIHGPVVRGNHPQLAAKLARFGVEASTRLDITCIQALLPIDDAPKAAALTAAGFRHVADLLYLFGAADTWPSRPSESELRFRTATQAELKPLIEQTYRGSLDCPAVDGLRTIEDVLAGYRATGIHQAEHWQVVTIAQGEGTRNVGCLLLADHPAADQMELVYMGIVPEERGRGWGSHLVRQAQWTVHSAGRKRLVLAVDEANQPAVRMYASCGLVSFDRMSLWLHGVAGSG